MIMVDREGTLLHASIRRNLAQHVIGILESIGPIEEVMSRGRPTKIRKIQLLLEENKSMQTTLWGSTALQIDDDFYKNNPGPFIVIITSTIVKTFRGDYNLSSTSATKIYIKLEIPEVERLLDNILHNTTVSKVKEIMVERPLKVSDRELHLHNRKTVAEIKEMEWNSETKEIFVTCIAKIINVNNRFGWYYIACIICKTKVKPTKSFLWCERCKAEPKFAVPSYRIQTEVEDATGSTTFILFDNGVEKIIPKTAKELAEMQDEELEKIIGKEYIFQLRLDEYNLKYGRENYTVSRIFDPDISEKNSTSNEAEIKKVTVQYIYLIMNSLVFKCHNEFVTLTHLNMYLGFFFFFGKKRFIMAFKL
ncbi:replication protein A 70 kDa DNA-binding subunit A-like [Fagus crenata]